MTPLRLTITTPLDLIVDVDGVRSLRAADESGSFGILPGHADLLTVVPASVIRWRGAGGAERYCAVRSAVMRVRGGAEVGIACRDGVLGDDLEALEARVKAAQNAGAEAERRARVEQMQLYARALRQLVRYLRGAGDADIA